MRVVDLEVGNLAKGLSGSLGAGEGRWRFTVSSNQNVVAQGLLRTADGFVMNLSSVTPRLAQQNSVLVMNPASNVTQKSLLRVMNVSTAQGSVSISAMDDSGAAAPGGVVSFNLAAGSVRTITAAELETGRNDLVGVLGDGSGKWQISVTADTDVQVQSLLEDAAGYVTNLSRGAD